MKRVQLKYYQKLPENTKKVSRPSRWGNPFKLKKHGGDYTLQESIIAYEIWLNKKLSQDPDFLKPLIGFNLGCFCKLDSPCHADILLVYVNCENNKSLDNFLKPQLKDWVKFLNYQGPVFQRR